MLSHILASTSIPYSFVGPGVVLSFVGTVIVVFGGFATLFGRTRIPGILLGGTAFVMGLLSLMLCGNPANDEGPGFNPVTLIPLTLLGVASGVLWHAIAIRSR